MKELDYLYRRPITVSIILSPSEVGDYEYAVSKRLPENYTLEGGRFSFPAGNWDSYIIQGKEYNMDGNLSLEEQRELIKKDFAVNGFSEQEASDFISQLKTKESVGSRLNWDASRKWLEHNSEFQHEALRILSKTRSEVETEVKSEIKGKRR